MISWRKSRLIPAHQGSNQVDLFHVVSSLKRNFPWERSFLSWILWYTRYTYMKDVPGMGVLAPGVGTLGVIPGDNGNKTSTWKRKEVTQWKLYTHHSFISYYITTVRTALTILRIFPQIYSKTLLIRPPVGLKKIGLNREMDSSSWSIESNQKTDPWKWRLNYEVTLILRWSISEVILQSSSLPYLKNRGEDTKTWRARYEI